MNSKIEMSEVRNKIPKPDFEAFKLMAQADLLEAAAFLSKLIRDEATRRGQWPPEADEGDPIANWRGVPDPPAVVLAEPKA